DVVDAGPERLHLTLEPLALPPNLFQAELGIPELTLHVLLRPRRYRCGGEEQQDREDAEGRAPDHSARRWRLTADALANTPKIPPAATPPSIQASGSHSSSKTALERKR